MKYHVIYVTMGLFCNDSFDSRADAKKFAVDNSLGDYTIVYGNLLI